ncbi:hypothetical protein MOV98_05210 [Acinetobacter variabilis]|nr:hypothetical protein MOV98_05210 [Acinetobacter variabilis]
MSHYPKYFATVYLTLVLIVGILIYVFNLGAILLIPALIASAFLSARYFVKRTPTTHPGREKQTGLGFHDYCHDLRIYLFVYSHLAASADGGNL